MTEEFQAHCDHCGGSFSSKIELWEDFDRLFKHYRRLMLIFNPTGFHEPGFCSKNCQMEAIRQVAEAAKVEYGETCCKCNRRIGTWVMKPCHVCKKIICRECVIDDGRSSEFCSKECQETAKHCAKCNILVSATGPDLCEWCTVRPDEMGAVG